MRRIILAAVAALVLATTAVAASGMALTYEYFSNGTNPNSPTWCYHEDSFHDRVWSGTLLHGESFAVPMRYCDPALDYSGGTWFGPGGEALWLQANYWTGHQSLSLAITRPDGSSIPIPYPPVRYDKRWTTLPVCVYDASQWPNGIYLQSGTYQVTVTNTGPNISASHPANLNVRTQMLDQFMIKDCAGRVVS